MSKKNKSNKKSHQSGGPKPYGNGSQKQQKANEANAKHSTGPTTSEGQAASSQNSTKHAIFSTKKVMPWESQDEYDDMYSTFNRQWLPVTMEEGVLMELMVDASWRLEQRLPAYEAVIMPESKDPEAALKLITRYEAHLERMFYRARAELKKVQEHRHKVERHRKRYEEKFAQDDEEEDFDESEGIPFSEIHKKSTIPDTWSGYLEKLKRAGLPLDTSIRDYLEMVKNGFVSPNAQNPDAPPPTTSPPHEEDSATEPSG